MIGRFTLSASLMLCLAAGPTTARAVDCYASAGPIGEKRWPEAERRLRAHLAADACAAQRPQLTYSLAYVLEMTADGDAERACEAEALYGEALEGLTGARVRDAAEQGRMRVRVTCRCQPPDALLAAGRWADAVEQAEAREGSLVCAPYAADLRAARARGLEAWAGEDAEVACRAADALERMATAPGALPETAPRARNMRRICDDLDAPGGHPSDGLLLFLEVSAVAFVATGTGLLVSGVAASERRADAERRYLQAPSAAQRDAAAADFEQADRLTSGLIIGGWAALAVAAGLGVGVAVELFGRSTTVHPALAPGAAGVVVRF